MRRSTIRLRRTRSSASETAYKIVLTIGWVVFCLVYVPISLYLLFHGVMLHAIIAGIAITSFIVEEAVIYWKIGKIKFPTVKLQEIQLPKFKLPKIKLPQFKLPQFKFKQNMSAPKQEKRPQKKQEIRHPEIERIPVSSFTDNIPLLRKPTEVKNENKTNAVIPDVGNDVASSNGGSTNI